MASKKAVWAGRIISALPVALLVMSAVMKLTKNPKAVEGFHHFGYEDWMIPVLGVVELLCTVIYLIPATSVIGAILLTGYLGGAVATHSRVGDPMFVMPVILGILLWLGLLLREGRLRPLLPLRR